MLPTSRATIQTQWKNFTEVQAAFNRIVPYQTRTNDLKALGFDPKASPNVKVLTYVDIIPRFMPNPAMTKKDLHPAVRECIEAKEKGHAYEVELSDIRTKRHGNVFLDMFGFKRKTHETGWRFKGLILLNDGLVVYTLASGEPDIVRDEQRIKPLGPLQEIDALVGGRIWTTR